MRKSRFTEEQIRKVLHEHGAGAEVAELLRRHNISHETFYRWKRKFGGMGVSDACRTIERGRQSYNEARSHSGLGGLTPAEFVRCLSQVGEPDQPRLSA